MGTKSILTHEHIIASSAIPVVFPPSQINGDYLGDGSLRDYTPLSPAIHLGADKLFIIGVRRAMNPITKFDGPPSLGKILSFVLNSILLDALDLDFERLQRINHTVKKIPDGSQHNLKNIETFFQMPSQDLGTIASRHFDDLDNAVKYLIKGLGDPDEGADIISYILFESKYTSELVKLGYEDTFKNEKEIRNFLTC
jgi:NTE family protein